MAGLLVLDNSHIEIVVTRGMTTPPALRAAVVLCVRQFYDGYQRDPPDRGFLCVDRSVEGSRITHVDQGFDPTAIWRCLKFRLTL